MTHLTTSRKLTVRPISIKHACAFVTSNHRHHQSPQGAKFAVQVHDGVRTVAVAIVGRPVARRLDDGLTAEVTRVCTDGTPHAASKVIQAAKRTCQQMGYVRVVTYLLSDETGVSLAAAGGWDRVSESDGGSWSRPSRGRIDKHPTGSKVRWETKCEVAA